jgi:hypothetical protein
MTKTFDLLMQKNDEYVALRKSLEIILSIIREPYVDYFNKINRIETIARESLQGEVYNGIR